MTNAELVNSNIAQIKNNLEQALIVAMNLQHSVHEAEGDSDLYRKLSSYLVPNLQHWLTGAQAGNIKDLNSVLTQREIDEAKKEKAVGKQGDGHEVLTSPQK